MRPPPLLELPSLADFSRHSLLRVVVGDEVPRQPEASLKGSPPAPPPLPLSGANPWIRLCPTNPIAQLIIK